MHKGYRELLAKIEVEVGSWPQLQPLLHQVDVLDDLNPLTVPAVKAMLRDPPPPLELTLVREELSLVVYARNTVRKRRASQATRVAGLECPAWIFSPESIETTMPQSLMLDSLALIKESIQLLGHRISNSFAVTFRDQLLIRPDPCAHVSIEEVPLGQRVWLNPDSRRARAAV